MIAFVLAFAVPFLLSLALTPLAGALGQRLGVVDRPGGRRRHQGVISRLGGIALYLSFVAGVILLMLLPAGWQPPRQDPNEAIRLIGLLVGSTVIFAIGLLDDFVRLKPAIQFAGQLVVAVIACLTLIFIERVMNPFTNTLLIFPMPLVWGISIFWIMGMINTVNFLDGVDGLAAGVTVIICAFLTIHMLRMEQLSVALLPLALLTSALTQALLLLHFINWIGWLIPIIIGMSALAAAALVILILFPPQRITRWAQAIATILGLVALFIAPTIWSLTPLASADSGLPFAGPELLARPMRSANMPSDNRLIEFVTANRNGAKFLVATLTANTAAPIILATGEPVMALGGFSGSDQILTPDQLAANVANNTVRFFWLPADGGQQPALTQWVKSNCRTVQTNAPRTPNSGPNPANQLYDCARTR